MLAIAAAIRSLATLVAQIGGLALLSAAFATGTAFLYRWYVRESVPAGLAVLVGLSAVAAYLSTTSVLGAVLQGSPDPTKVEVALFNIAVFGVGTAAAYGGRAVGDRFGADVFDATGLANLDEEVGTLVRTVGRVISFRLPEEIDDVVGYDPVPAETKAALAGAQFYFPRRLTVPELEERLTTRLKTDYAVGHVDVELADDGTVEYLGLGSRAAGIGPTLPPATNAVAIRADPAFAASAGDIVQVWETDPMRRVLTAELRGVAGDVVTLAIDASDTPKLDPTETYRLVTLPVEDRPDREFADLLRAADETFSTVTVAAGSSLDGVPVGALDVTVIATGPEGESPTALPDPTHVLRAGDLVHAIARPEALRRLETGARPRDSVEVTDGSPGPAVDDPAVADDAGDNDAAAGDADGTTDSSADLHETDDILIESDADSADVSETADPGADGSNGDGPGTNGDEWETLTENGAEDGDGAADSSSDREGPDAEDPVRDGSAGDDSDGDGPDGVAGTDDPDTAPDR